MDLEAKRRISQTGVQYHQHRVQNWRHHLYPHRHEPQGNHLHQRQFGNPQVHRTLERGETTHLLRRLQSGSHHHVSGEIRGRCTDQQTKTQGQRRLLLRLIPCKHRRHPRTLLANESVCGEYRYRKQSDHQTAARKKHTSLKPQSGVREELRGSDCGQRWETGGRVQFDGEYQV